MKYKNIVSNNTEAVAFYTTGIYIPIECWGITESGDAIGLIRGDKDPYLVPAFYHDNFDQYGTRKI